MPSISSPLSFLFKTMKKHLTTTGYWIDVQEHLIDNELDQVMEIINNALERSYNEGFIKGDLDNHELTIKTYIPED